MQRSEKRVFLDLHHAFGSNCSMGFKDCVALFEEEKNEPRVIFPVGKCIAKKALDRNEMEFVRLSDNLESMECFCISPRKTHVAICEKLRGENILIMALYSLRSNDTEKKVFRYVPNAEMKATTFKAFAFSPSEQKFMCCLTGDPDYQLIFIDNSRMRGLAFSSFSLKEVNRISICPNQSHLISASGKNFFRLYKVEEYAFKPLDEVKKLPKNRNFTEHAWCEKTKILLGTDRGEIFLVGPIGNSYEVKREFLNAFNETSPDISVTAICPFSKGFILGSDQGKFALWVKKEDNQDNYDDEETVDLVRKWSTSNERKAEITCIDISAKEDTIVMSFRNNDIATIDMNEILPQTLESMEALKKAKEKDIYFDYLFKGFHNAPITAMDVCLQRPLIATCSKQDNTIRIWNYKNTKCELLRMFSFKNKENGMDDKTLNPLITLAFHPSGYYLAVGCVDKLRFYHVLNTELRSYREIVVKGVSQLKFSNGGHLLAAAYPKQKYNIHHVNIYNAYTLEEVAHLADHSNVVTEMLWTRNDEFLLTAGLDGAIIEWKVSDWTCKKFTQSSSRYSSVMLNYQTSSILAAGVEGNKSVVRQIKLDKEREVYQKVHQMNVRPTKLQWLISHWNYPAILAGTDDGCLKLFSVNFDTLADQTINAHSREVVALQTSPCGRYVFTVGEDGVLFIYQVSITYKDGTLVRKRAVEGKEFEELQLNPYVSVVDDFLADIVLVNRSDIDEQLRLQKQLRCTIEEQENRMLTMTQESEKRLQAELNELQQSKDKKIADLQSRMESLKKQKKSLELKSEADLKDLESKNVRAAEELQTLYERKLSFENEKYFQLEQELMQLRIKYGKEMDSLQATYNANIQLLKGEFSESFNKAEKVYTATKQSSDQIQRIFDERVNQIEDEHEMEIRELNTKKHRDEEQAKRKIGELNQQIGQLRREKADALEKQNLLQQQKDELQSKKKTVDRELSEATRKIEEKTQELQEKDEQMRGKDRKLSEFQVKVNDLQKKKHVLSYKATEMRKSMEPKEAQIEKLKEQIFRLEQEFEEVLQDQQKNLLSMERVEKEKQLLMKSLKEQAAHTREKELLLGKICTDIFNCMEKKETDPKFYYREMVALKHKYVDRIEENHANQDPKGVEEMNRQIVHLEKSIHQVNKTADKAITRRTEEVTKKTKENAQLIFDLNEIRKKNKEQLVEMKNKDKEIYQLRRDLALLNSELKRGDRPSASKVSEDPGQQDPAKAGFSTPLTTLVRSTSLKTSLRKGKVIKGPNYDAQTLSTFDKAKISELVGEIDSLTHKLTATESILTNLKGRVRKHLEDHQCKDSPLADEVIELSQIH